MWRFEVAINLQNHRNFDFFFFFFEKPIIPDELVDGNLESSSLTFLVDLSNWLRLIGAPANLTYFNFIFTVHLFLIKNLENEKFVWRLEVGMKEMWLDFFHVGHSNNRSHDSPAFRFVSALGISFLTFLITQRVSFFITRAHLN